MKKIRRESSDTKKELLRLLRAKSTLKNDLADEKEKQARKDSEFETLVVQKKALEQENRKLKLTVKAAEKDDAIAKKASEDIIKLRQENQCLKMTV